MSPSRPEWGPDDPIAEGTRHPNRLPVIAAALLLLTAASPRAIEAQDVVISELMARNATTLLDEDSESSDWIEIYNGSLALVNLAGWALSDDPTDLRKWPFPPVDMAPGEFLIVFASGKDRTETSELHTSFRLSGGGEFVGLISPSEQLASAFAPQYPEQIIDVSYGFPMTSEVTELVSPMTEGRALVPERASDLPADWNTPDFDDSAWTPVVTSVGFDRKEALTLTGLFTSDLGDLMFAENSSVFLRIPHESANSPAFLQVRARYDSGFVLYLNGVEILRENASRNRYNSSASSGREPSSVAVERLFPVPLPPGVWRDQGNVLGVHAQNDNRRSEDFLFSATVESVVPTGLAGSTGSFFSTPTPGWTNPSEGQQGLSARPRFSAESTVFAGSLIVSLNSPAADAEIRYTLDGTTPGELSNLYTEPLELTEITRIVARAFEPGKVGSEVAAHSYVAVDDETLAFSSDVPIVLVTTFGGRNIGTTRFLPMHMQVIDRGDDGRAAMTDARDFSGDGGIKERGSSTQGRPKKAFSVEIQDTLGRDLDVEILGLPADSDWVLYAAYNFDRALMRNPFMYRLARRIGRYAVRDRFCEVFVNTRDGILTQDDYLGVYSFMEKISRGEHRVDVEELPASALEEPEISGGYMLKIDREDPGDRGFSAGGVQVLYVDPKEDVIEGRPEQVQWIREYFSDFGAALSSTVLGDPESYADYIDVPSWVDHHILNEFAKNPDGFWLSTYFYKPRGGKVFMGPIWDFDRALGPADDARARSPVGWSGVQNSNWWARLLRDQGFKREIAARWLELREGPMRTEVLVAIVDDMEAELLESAPRNFEKWRLSLGAGGWPGQVSRFRNWIIDRAAWMDEVLTPSPLLSHEGGPVERGFELTMTVPSGTIYYTTNGEDPRAETGEISPGALRYEAPLVITQNTRIMARNRVGTGLWSTPVEATYVTDVPPIFITEIMYNPPVLPGDTFSATSFEFFELFCGGAEPLDLMGWEYKQVSPTSSRVLFDFSEIEDPTLAPGEYAVLVRDVTAFRSRYGDGIRILGEYSSWLSNTSDTLVLLGPLGEPFVQFEYDDSWYPSTDGEGHSLVLKEPPSPRASWSEAEAWEPSADVAGSPGRSDVLTEGLQLPGDLSQDGQLDLRDVLTLLEIFRGRSSGPCVIDAANVSLTNINGVGGVDLSDLVGLVNYLFLRGVPPAAGVDCVPVRGCPDTCTN
jgi:hypothetical protein